MKARRVKKLDPAAPLADNAARIIRVRLDELRSFAPGALDRSAGVEQHDMRIAAKRLRYVLEATGFCFGKPADRARGRARDLQEVLGDLHDCEVMLPRVREHGDSLATADAARGLDLLEADVEERRALLFDRFVALWGELERDGTWRKLECAIDRRHDQP